MKDKFTEEETINTVKEVYGNLFNRRIEEFKNIIKREESQVTETVSE